MILNILKLFKEDSKKGEFLKILIQPDTNKNLYLLWKEKKIKDHENDTVFISHFIAGCKYILQPKVR